MLTATGKFLRKIRIDRGELLRDMADYLGVTASYVSAVETGKRAYPREWTEQIVTAYNLNDAQRRELEDSIIESAEEVRIRLEEANATQKHLAFSFARCFEQLDESTIERIQKLLEEGKR
jgi:transcriptional regulator with XRE-family HTH domain